GYIVLGNIDNPSFSILIRLNSFGDTLWTKGYQSLTGKVVQQTSDGGFIIAGAISLPSSQLDDAYLLKTDSMGEVLWKKTYGYYNKDEMAESLVLTTDSGIIFTGTTEGPSASSKNIWVIKTNNVGDTVWTKE